MARRASLGRGMARSISGGFLNNLRPLINCVECRREYDEAKNECHKQFDSVSRKIVRVRRVDNHLCAKMQRRGESGRQTKSLA